MAMSSVTVVGNSILLGRYKPRFTNKSQKKKGSTGPRTYITCLKYNSKGGKSV
jgi:hypothetical protein